jgi:hypothetical protein
MRSLSSSSRDFREFPRGCVVPRYYIDVRSHFGTEEDHSGIEVPDLSAARAEALKVAERLLQSWAAIPADYSRDIMIEIVGEDLRPVLIIPCSEIGLIPRE